MPPKKSPTKTNSDKALTLLERKVRFARKHWKAPGGETFEIDEAGWLYQEYWRPLHSFRAVVLDLPTRCDGCAADAGQLFEEYRKPGCRHGAADCAGTRLEPIQMVLLDLPRRSGKSVGTSGFVAASLFRGRRESIAFISGSEDQSARLFSEHYVAPIVENPDLAARARITGTKIEVWESAEDKHDYEKNGTPLPSCRFVFVSTSISGTTGGKNTVVVIDEARAVPGDVFAALEPSTWDQNGWECPTGARGHTKTTGDLDRQTQEICAQCGTLLVPYTGRVLAMSSAGELTGGLRDWFFDTCSVAEAGPKDPGSLEQRRAFARFHVYRAQGVVNRKVAASSVSTTATVLGSVDSLRDFVEIETNNQARRRGEDFITHNEISAVIDRKLTNASSGARPGVAFLDVSDSVELTSLVIVEDDSTTGAEETWSRLVVSRIDVWDPKKIGRIEAAMLEDHLDAIVPVFKLLRLRIDDRHAGWVRNMVARLKKTPWGRSIVVGCTEWNREERRLAWNETERRLLGRTIRLPDNPILRAELKAARKFRDIDNRVDVREVSRKRRHLDIAEALAGACYDVHTIAGKNRIGLVTTEAPSPARAVLAKLYRPRITQADLDRY